MKMAKFLVSHFDAGAVKFKAGESYPLDDETRLCVVRGAAVEVDVPDEAPEPHDAAEATAAPAADAASGDAAAPAPTEAPAPAPAAQAPKGKK